MFQDFLPESSRYTRQKNSRKMKSDSGLASGRLLPRSGSPVMSGQLKPRSSRNRNKRQGTTVSLADRIKLIRENKADLTAAKEEERRTSWNDSDLHSLIAQYREMLGNESRLGAGILRSISLARSSNSKIRRKIYQDYDGSRSQPATMANKKGNHPGNAGSSRYSSYAASVSDMSLPSISGRSSVKQTGSGTNRRQSLQFDEITPPAAEVCFSGSSNKNLNKVLSQSTCPSGRQTHGREAEAQPYIDGNYSKIRELTVKPSTKRERGRNSRCYLFVGQSLSRSLSLPNMKEIPLLNTKQLLKDYRGTDIEQLMYSRKSKSDVFPLNTFLPGQSSSPGGRSFGRRCRDRIRLPPLSETNRVCSKPRSKQSRYVDLIATRLYLRSQSCDSLRGNKTKLTISQSIRRFASLYKDLKSLESLSTQSESVINMTLKPGNIHNLNVIVTWGTNVKEESLTLYTKPSYMTDTRAVGRVLSKRDFKRVSRQPSTFLYPQDIPMLTTCGACRGVDNVQRFMESTRTRFMKLS